MRRGRTSKPSRETALAGWLCEALERERIVPRFVDTYVVEHERYGLQVHPVRYRELLEVVGREALLAMTARALAAAARISEGGRPRPSQREATRTARLFRGRLLAALARQRNWSAGDALEFQSDLALYERHEDASRGPRNQRRPGHSQGPFVDRCAFLLDPSLMEQARSASAKLAAELEQVVTALVDKVFTAL